MVILKLLSEEIFEFSAEQMTTAKTKALKAQIVRDLDEATANAELIALFPLAVPGVLRCVQPVCRGAGEGRQG